MSAPRVRIGITRWEDIPGERYEAYCERLAEAGAQPVELSGPDTNVPALNGLLLTGGLDICPERYGEARHPKVKQTDAARDEFEFAALRQALAADLPVLAICRGHQLLNVALGGRLLQHIESDDHKADFKRESFPSNWHTIRLAPGSRLRAILAADGIEVNSRHHQAVLPETLAPGLEAVAFSPDGLIEAVESRKHGWIIGVQWHPELLEAGHPGFADRCRPLLEAFVAEARRVREPA